MERLGDDERTVQEGLAAAASFKRSPRRLPDGLAARLIGRGVDRVASDLVLDEVGTAVWRSFYNAAVRHLYREGHASLAEHVEMLGRAANDAREAARRHLDILPLMRERAVTLAAWSDRFGSDAPVVRALPHQRLQEEGRLAILEGPSRPPAPASDGPKRRGTPRVPSNLSTVAEGSSTPFARKGSLSISTLGVYSETAPGLSDAKGKLTVGLARSLNDLAWRRTEEDEEALSVRSELLWQRFSAASEVVERYLVLGHVDLVAVEVPDAFAEVEARLDSPSALRRAERLRSDPDYVRVEALRLLVCGKVRTVKAAWERLSKEAAVGVADGELYYKLDSLPRMIKRTYGLPASAFMHPEGSGVADALREAGIPVESLCSNGH